MEISTFGKVILYTDIVVFGLFCLVLWGWQVQVLRGRSMKNPDGSFDDWHEQKLCYGIALADIFVAVPVALVGIVLIFFKHPLGFYLTGLTSFWYLWANVATTATSLRFEKPAVTFLWIVAFPLGIVLGLVYIIWSIVYFDVVF